MPIFQRAVLLVLVCAVSLGAQTRPLPDSSTAGASGGLLRASPLVLPTARQLPSGRIEVVLRNRFSLVPTRVVSGTHIAPTLAVAAGLPWGLAATLDLQTVDPVGPGQQGPLLARRKRGPYGFDEQVENVFNERTLQLAAHLWGTRGAGDGARVSLVGAMSFSLSYRHYAFYDSATVPVAPGAPDSTHALLGTRTTKATVYSLALPATLVRGAWEATLSPTVAFFPREHALWLWRLPRPGQREFGTTVGVAGGAAFAVSPAVRLWGDVLVPVTGHNTIDRASGQPSRVPVYNAGARLVRNPAVALDLFLSNALGNTGPLGVLADKEYTSVSVSLTFIPLGGSPPARPTGPTGATGPTGTAGEVGGRARTMAAPLGLTVLDRELVPNGAARTTVRGGSQGVLAEVRAGVAEDVEVGGYIDDVRGDVDETVIALSGGLRLLDQRAAAPFTLLATVDAGKTGQAMLNRIVGRPDALRRRGLTQHAIFDLTIGDEQGRTYLLAGALAARRQTARGDALWAAASLSHTGRFGIQTAGVSGGIDVRLGTVWTASADAGVETSHVGNTFVGGVLTDRIPWGAGIAWRPVPSSLVPFALQAYVTNRPGASVHHALRVRASNRVAVGIGGSLGVGR